MSTSFMSPNSGPLGQFDAHLAGQHQGLHMPEPQEAAWLMQGQGAAPLQEPSPHSRLAWQRLGQVDGHLAVHCPGLSEEHVRLLLAGHQQSLLAASAQPAQHQQQQQQQQEQLLWEQQQQQMLAAGLQDSLQSRLGNLQGLRPQQHPVPSSGELMSTSSSHELCLVGHIKIWQPKPLHFTKPQGCKTCTMVCRNTCKGCC